MIARGALIKPWIFTEIKEQRHWDQFWGAIKYIKGLFTSWPYWGSDTKRYVPFGLLDVIPQRLNWCQPSYYGCDDLETLWPLILRLIGLGSLRCCLERFRWLYICTKAQIQFSRPSRKWLILHGFLMLRMDTI